MAGLKQWRLEEIANAIFNDDREKRQAMQILSGKGIRTGKDIERVLGEPDNVRRQIGRPLPSFLSKALVSHGLLPEYTTASDGYFGDVYLRRREDKQSRETAYVIQAFLDPVSLTEQQRAKIAALLPKVMQDPEHANFLDYKWLLEEMCGFLPIRYHKMEMEMPVYPIENYSAAFKFYNESEKIIWCLIVAGDRYTDSPAVGGLMYIMDKLFSENPQRSFALGAVIVVDFIWVFKFIPESYEPVACLYQLLENGGIYTLAKLMCASCNTHGLIQE